jgi:hypothetical protein
VADGGEIEIVGDVGAGPDIEDGPEAMPGPEISKFRGNVGVAATIPMSGTLATLKAAGSVGLAVAASFIDTALVLAEGPAFGWLNDCSVGVTITLEALSL